MTTTNLPPCPLPDCGINEHHFHDMDPYAVEEGHDCASEENLGYRCYGPHRPQSPQWQPIELDEIKAGMRIRTSVALRDLVTTHIGVAHHIDDGDWYTESGLLLTAWYVSTTYEVDPTSIPDPDAELIEALREASWRIEHMGGHSDPLPGLPEARDLLNKLRELGWTVTRESAVTGDE